MRRRRWPDGAETQRRTAIAAIRDARESHREIRTLADKLEDLLRKTMNEPLAHWMLADIRTACGDAGEALADAERLLVLAKLGEKEED